MSIILFKGEEFDLSYIYHKYKQQIDDKILIINGRSSVQLDIVHIIYLYKFSNNIFNCNDDKKILDETLYGDIFGDDIFSDNYKKNIKSKIYKINISEPSKYINNNIIDIINNIIDKNNITLT
jgi:hypothetical protein